MIWVLPRRGWQAGWGRRKGCCCKEENSTDLQKMVSLAEVEVISVVTLTIIITKTTEALMNLFNLFKLTSCLISQCPLSRTQETPPPPIQWELWGAKELGWETL